jgi:hypothetical protein
MRQFHVTRSVKVPYAPVLEDVAGTFCGYEGLPIDGDAADRPIIDLIVDFVAAVIRG